MKNTTTLDKNKPIGFPPLILLLFLFLFTPFASWSQNDVDVEVIHTSGLGSEDGIIRVDLILSEPPATVEIDGPSGNFSQEVNALVEGFEVEFTGLEYGLYDLSIIDAKCDLSSEIEVLDCSDDETFVVFDYSPNGLIVSFNNESSACTAFTEWFWDFGDGNTSTEQNPIHAFSAGGWYEVSLTAYTAFGSFSEIQDISVEDGGNLTAMISGPSNAAIGQEINFTSIVAGGSGSYSYTWDFGSGSSSINSSIANPDVVYSTGGTKTITLTVSDLLGGDQITTTEVINIETTSLNIMITTEEVGPMGIIFSSLVTGNVGLINYSWNFGVPSSNLNTSTLASPQFQYSANGIYTVTLEVCDQNGCKTKTIQVIIGNDLYVDFLPVQTIIEEDPDLNIPTIVEFESTVAGGDMPHHYQWDFGDGSDYSNEVHPTHEYFDYGIFSVTLIVTDVFERKVAETKYNLVRRVEGLNINGIGLTNNCGGSPPFLHISPTGGIRCNQQTVPSGPCAGNSDPYDFYDWSIVGAGSLMFNSKYTPCPEFNLAHPFFDPLDNGEAMDFTVKVIVIDCGQGSNGTTRQQLSHVTVYPQMSIDAEDVTSCPGQVVQLGAFPTATGGHAPYTYYWLDKNGQEPEIGEGPGQLSCIDCPNPVTTVPQIGEDPITFKLSVEDSRPIVNHCTLFKDITVKGVDLSVDAGGGSAGEIITCIGESARQLGASIPEETATGGSGNYSYLWSPTTGLSNPTIPNPIVMANSTEAITYSLLVTDNHGCYAFDNVVVSGAESFPEAYAGTDRLECFNSTPVLGANPSSGGILIGNPQFIWSSPDANFGGSTEANPTLLSQNAFGVFHYELQVIDDATGCVASDEIELRIQKEWVVEGFDGGNISIACASDQPSVSTFSSSQNNILGPFGTSELDPQLPITYAWSHPELVSADPLLLSPPPFFSATAKVPFITLIATDALGCKREFDSNIILTDSGPPDITLSISDGTDPCLEELLCIEAQIDRHYNQNYDNITINTLDDLVLSWIEGGDDGTTFPQEYGPSANGDIYEALRCTETYLGWNLYTLSATNTCGTTETSIDAFVAQVGDLDGTELVCTPQIAEGGYSGNIVESGGNCDAVVPGNTAVSFVAATHVSLKPGFAAQPASYFHAYISEEECDPGMMRYVSETEEEKEEPSEEDFNKDFFAVFPNPFKEQIGIQFSITQENGGLVSLSIFDLSGKKHQTVIDQKVMARGNYQQTLDVSHLAPGIYFFELHNNGLKQIKRVVKIK